MILHRSSGVPAAADEAAGPAATRLPLRRVTAIMLLAAAALDLTRCGLVVGTVTQAGAAAALVSVGLAAAAVSLWTACGCQHGTRWSGWAAFLIGTRQGRKLPRPVSTPLYAIPDTATAVLGVLVAAGVLATVGRTRRPASPQTQQPRTDRLICHFERCTTTKRVSRYRARPSRPAEAVTPERIFPSMRRTRKAIAAVVTAAAAAVAAVAVRSRRRWPPRPPARRPTGHPRSPSGPAPGSWSSTGTVS